MCDQRVGIAIVRRPGRRLCEGLVTFQERDVVSFETALCQWQAYVDTFRHHGWKILEVEPAEDCPDAVFIEVRPIACRRCSTLKYAPSLVSFAHCRMPWFFSTHWP